MNLIKSIFALLLIGLSAQICAHPIKIQCSDRTVEYDDQVVRALKSHTIEYKLEFTEEGHLADQDNISIKLPIDSKGFAFMIALASKDNAQLFRFIDSFDEQTFRLVSFYTQLLREHRIADLLKYKMFKNPKLQQLAELNNHRVKDFIIGNYFIFWNHALHRYETLLNKYLDSNRNENCYGSEDCYKNFTADSIYALLVLIDFYQETLKKQLPLDTDHLKNLFFNQPYDIQQTLLNNKKLVILP